jgi:hypothetical protein
VRYSQNAIGNWQQEELNHLFNWLNDRADHLYYFWYNEDSLECSYVIEWQRDGVKDAIAILRKMDEVGESWDDIPLEGSAGFGDWSISEWLQNRLNVAEVNAGITPRKVADFLQGALEEGEPDIEYVRFEWL